MKTTANGAARSEWVTQVEAMHLLKCSERTLQRRVRDGLIEMQTQQRSGRVPEPMYRQADIDKLTTREAFLVHTPGGSTSPPPPQYDDLARALTPMLAAFRIANALPAGPPPNQQPWLDLAGAAEFTGLSERLLRSLIKAHRLPAIRDGRTWKAHRVDLAAIRHTLLKDSANRASPPRVAQSDQTRRGGKGKKQ